MSLELVERCGSLQVAVMEIDSIQSTHEQVEPAFPTKLRGEGSAQRTSGPAADQTHIEDKLDEQGIEIDVLSMEIDQHKQAIGEYIKLLEDRDSTIGTQSFVITSLHDSVYRLTGEVTQLSGTIRTQNFIITSLHHSIHSLTDEVAHLSGMIEQTRDQKSNVATTDWTKQDESAKKRRLGVKQWNSGSSPINSLLAPTIFDSAGMIFQAIMTGLKDQQRNMSSDELASKVSQFFSGPENDVRGNGRVSPLALGLLTLALVWWISLAQMARRVIL
ncbi:uncharacterized protein FFNC_15551 [Fusarium fujikuroi]|nr:uncharacterized protein FFNC_15551 [Fusarium fujikuroi]